MSSKIFLLKITFMN